MFGLPADTVRKKFRTRCVRDNGLNPIYDDEPFVFKKVVLPELASIRIAAYEEGGKFIGHRVLPVIGLCPGYKHVTLRTELGLPIALATLFLCIVVKVKYFQNIPKLLFICLLTVLIITALVNNAKKTHLFFYHIFFFSRTIMICSFWRCI